MKKIEVINIKNAPVAIGPYSQGIIFNDLIFTSGQIPITKENKIIISDIELQTKQALNNLKNILESSNSSLNCVIKTTIFLTNMNNFDKMNKIYESFFLNHKPARSTVCVKELPKNALVEIECIAYKITNLSKM